jgi:photosystem II stability/assembly factor-like uncharacterized protein
VDLEHELTRVLRTHDTALPVADPVEAVHAGMRRRRRTQRLQVAVTTAAVIGVVGGVGWAITDNPLRTHSAPGPVVSQPVGVPVPAGFTATDLSWVTVQDGFAIGTAPCGTTLRCAHVLRTTDGGATWSDTSASGLVKCADLCPNRVRFADTQTGYAFGGGLYMTTDGGMSWTSQPGPDTYGLEVANGTAVRVVTRTPGCPGCQFEVQRSTVGSTTWDTVRTSDEYRTSADLVRQLDAVAVALKANPAGGAGDAHISLLLSADGGTTWTRRDDPCRAASQGVADEVDAVRVQLSLRSEVVALCQRRTLGSDGGNTSLTISSDGGATFSTPTGFPAHTDASLVAAGRGVLLAETHQANGTDVVLQRSTDDGRTWAEVARAPLPNGDTAGPYLAFSTGSTATWVPQAGTSVWRSSDGGQTWTVHAFAG